MEAGQWVSTRVFLATSTKRGRDLARTAWTSAMAADKATPAGPLRDELSFAVHGHPNETAPGAWLAVQRFVGFGESAEDTYISNCHPRTSRYVRVIEPPCHIGQYVLQCHSLTR